MDHFGVQPDCLSFSFPKEERLTKNFQFKKVYRQGRSYKGRYLVLCVLRNGLGVNRAGFSAAKSMIKKANRRNRLKRVFRETYRRNKDKVAKGYDIVLVSGQSCITEAGRLSPQAIEKELLALLKRAGVLVK